MKFTFDGQGYLTGISVNLTPTGQAAFSTQSGILTIPQNTYVGAQWVNDDTVQFGFSNPVFVEGMPNAYVGQATYSDVGNGSFTSVTGAIAIGAMPLGSTDTYSGPITDSFNNGSNADLLSSIGNSLVSTMDDLHDNVTCSDIAGFLELGNGS